LDERFQSVLASVEPLLDSIRGPRYRCAITLKDGTHLPCAVLRSKQKIIELAKRRIREESSGKGMLRLLPDPYGEILSTFVADRNCIDDDNVAFAALSKFAPPPSLLKRIHGETTMGWTGWVFEMKDGKRFQFGSKYSMEFFHLPDGYSFDDVTEVHNHSYLSSDGALQSLKRGGMLPDDYKPATIFRERIFFTCYIGDISLGSSENKSEPPPGQKPKRWLRR
jgi:hypothetical protein